MFRVSSTVFPLFLLILACAAQQQSQPVSVLDHDRGLRARVNLKSWDDGGELSHWVFLHTSEVFPASEVRRSGTVRELPVHLRPEIGDFVVDENEGHPLTLRDFIARGDVDGFIVLHKGVIVYEDYPHMLVGDRHLSFSVTKAFVGTALGILENEGRIDLTKPVEQYLPEFAGTAWAGTRVRDIADMASGMEGVEDSPDAYTDPAQKQFQLEAALGWQPLPSSLPASVRSGDVYEFLKTFKRVAKPGEAQAYNSSNTEVLADLIERVTDKPLARVISDLIWTRIGPENDAYLVVNSKGYPLAHGGMVLTLRDLARFGLFFTPSGSANPGGGVPAPVLRRLLEPRQPALLSGKHPAWFSHSSYQWDAVSKYGQIAKGGWAGQLLFVDCKKDVVIAYFGTNKNNQWAPTPLPLVALIARYF
jgi:CubicO group peptidase (beta-lactamase class C family)